MAKVSKKPAGKKTAKARKKRERVPTTKELQRSFFKALQKLGPAMERYEASKGGSRAEKIRVRSAA